MRTTKRVTLTETRLRYHWTKPSDLPERLELIDRITGHSVAVIQTVSRQYEWKRSTSAIIHGAPPAEGECETLSDAKIQVEAGLPNEM
ncbi:hypothetical protein [Anatilimnocola floriformis]|uniref:hypothetical protein n=1 Tax=Anatilimnocola floriformis TaxID=2948575 RepID=UPI0020C48D2B|nr:hypothetical protein [Anatilimnocola floriformis]